jgi:molybdopterin converting factor small subunit
VIAVRLFGMTKMMAGNQGTLSLNLIDGSRVKDLISMLETGYPAIGELIQKRKVLVSVNQEIAHEETEIRDGDEVALLPPFAGGTSVGC